MTTWHLRAKVESGWYTTYDALCGRSYDALCGTWAVGDEYAFDEAHVTCAACLAQMAAEVERALDKPNENVIAGETLDTISATYGQRRKPGETDDELRRRLGDAIVWSGRVARKT